MSWLNTVPSNSPDPGKKFYIFFYDKEKKTTRRTVTKFYNTTTGKRDAKRFKKEFDLNINDRQFYNKFTSVAASTIKLQAVFEKFIDSRNIEKASIKMYESAFYHFIKSTGNKPVQNVTSVDYTRFVKKLKSDGLSPNTIHSYTKHLKVIWDWILKSNFVSKNIVEVTKPEYLPPRIIPDNDLKIIFRYFKESNLVHYYTSRFFYLSGLRISSVIELRLSNIDWQSKLIFYRNVKGKKNSILPMHRELEKLIRAMIKEFKLKNDDKLIPYTHKSLCFWKRALKNDDLKKHKFNYTLHQLRKTYATTLVNYNLSIYDIKNLLDHSNIKTTETFYALAVNSRIRKEIDKNVKFVKE